MTASALNRGYPRPLDAAQSRWLEARALAQRNGEDDPDALAAYLDVAELLVADGDADAAGPLLGWLANAWAATAGTRSGGYGRALLLLGASLRGQGQLDDAETLLADAEQSLQAALADGARGAEAVFLLNQIARCRHERGRHDEEAEPLEAAHAILRELGPIAGLWRATSARNLAGLHRDAEDYPRAAELGREAVGILRDAEDPLELAAALVEVGQDLMAGGDIGAAEPVVDEALGIYRDALEPDDPRLAGALALAARVRLELGDGATANAFARLALAIAEGRPGVDASVRFAACQVLAVLAAGMGDPDGAEAWLGRVADAGEPAALELAWVYLNTGRPQDARHVFERWDHATRDAHRGPRWARAASNYARLLAELDELAEADAWYERATAAGGEPTSLRAELLRGHGATRHALGDADGAAARLDESLAIERELLDARLSRLSEREAIGFLAALARDTGDALELALACGGGERVLEVLLLHGGRLRLSAWAAPERAAERPRLLRLRSELAELVLGAASEETAGRAVALRLEIGVAEERLARAAPAAVRAPRREEIAAALPPGTVLVQLVRVAGRYVALMPELVDLGDAAEIDAAALAWRADVQGLGSGDPQAATARLSRLVSVPLARRLGDAAQLVVVPDGALIDVPLAALRDESGAYLGERCAILHATSAADVLPQPAGDPGPALVGGDPDFGGGAGPFGEFEPLPDARAEAEAIGALLGVRPLLGPEVSKAAVLAAERPRFLHLATHGRFAAADELELDARAGAEPFLFGGDEPMLRGALMLTGANASPAGVLTAFEVAAMDLTGTELVALSACETGLGSLADGAGVLGLQRAFRAAGARRLLMTLWELSDEPARRLMDAFYRELLGGAATAEALRTAQDVVRRDYPDPVDWAGFVCLGEPGALSA